MATSSTELHLGIPVIGIRKKSGVCGGIPCLLLLFFSIPGCQRAQPPQAQTKPPEVQVTLPVAQTITDFEDYTGQTQAENSVDIRARVTGYLQEADFMEGKDVTKGQKLFVIDPRPYQALLDQAKADLESKKAAADRAEALYRRTQELRKSNAAPQEEVDKNKGDWEVAKADVGLTEAKVKEAQLNIDFTVVNAPLSGRISRRNVDPGNLVNADTTLLTSIVNLDPMFANFDVDEHTLLKFRRLILQGKVKSAREAIVPVWLGLADEEGYPHEGTINFVDNKVDPNTGTLRVRGVFPNANVFLAPGMFVRIRVQIGLPHPAILIPERAMGTDQGQKFLYVVNDQDQVIYRLVKVGALEGTMRVVDEGLASGERVIVNGLQRVHPGIKVQPTLEKEQPQPSEIIPKEQGKSTALAAPGSGTTSKTNPDTKPATTSTPLGTAATTSSTKPATQPQTAPGTRPTP